MVIRKFLATDTIITRLLATGVDLSVNWMQREKQFAKLLAFAFTVFSSLLFYVGTLWATGILRVNIFDKEERKRLNPFNFLKSNVEVVDQVEETFDSVAGADEAKEELMEIVDFLK